MYAIKVPQDVIDAGKETQYINAAHANIARNASVTRRKKWMAAHDDAQTLFDWLFGVGDFRSYWTQTVDGVTTKIDQPSGEELDRYEDEYRLRHVFNPLTSGIFAGDFGDFLLGLREQLDERGGLSEKQTQIIRDALARKRKWVAEAEQRRADAISKDKGSEFVGEIKERREWSLIIRKVISFHGQFGMTYFNIMNDTDGNVVVGKGTKRYGEAGDKIEVTATVVKHDVRDGVNQTIINRPKFK